VTTAWCLVETKPRAEATASYWLHRLGLQVFCPSYLKTRCNRRNTRKIETVPAPLFPRYVFVRGTVRRTEVESTIGCSRLFTHGDGEPQKLSDTIINLIRQRIDPHTGYIPATPEGEPLITRHDYRENKTMLRIKDGPYTDIKGLFLRDAGERVRVLLNFMGGKVEHEFPARSVEAVAA
jgi:transcriptional antiterminator RfaH